MIFNGGGIIMGKVAELQGEVVKKNLFIRYLIKMRGGERAPSRTNFADAATGAFGGLVCMLLLVGLTNYTGTPWLMASMGGSCVLVFVVWNAPLSQPRNIIGGHFISSFIGILFYSLFGSGLLSITFGVGLTIFCMAILGIIHPPAGANPIIIILGGYSWGYLVAPVLIGAVIIVTIGLIINNLRDTRKYPVYW